MKKTRIARAAFVSAAFAIAFASCQKSEQKPAPAAEKNTENQAAKSEAATPAPKAEEAAAVAEENPAKPELVNKQFASVIFISANDLEAGVINAATAAEDGFSLNATEEKTLEIQDISKNPVTVGEDTFTKRISTKGSGSAEFRNISFAAKEGDEIIVYCGSSSKTDARPLHIVNIDSGEEVGIITMAADGSNKVTVDEVVAPKDGNYCVFSKSGTGYIYQIKVGK